MERITVKISKWADRSGFWPWLFHYKLRQFLKFRIHSDKYLIEKSFYRHFKYKLNLKEPQTLNEKIQWLKLYERDELHTICADKFASRKYLEQKFGKEYLIPLYFYTNNWNEINEKTVPEAPCIIKPNNNCGKYYISRDKSLIDWKKIKLDCRKWLHENMYYATQEWQYKNMKPYILVEKLLVNKNGKLPNDYKLLFLNGKLQFIYVSVDREGENCRNIYDDKWNPLYFQWVKEEKYRNDLRGKEVHRPLSFDKMVEMGECIAKDFKCVRVDFYDVDGKLYFGEITLHHGSGLDHFFPDKYDMIYGKKIFIER